jgi:hypothetical protein
MDDSPENRVYNSLLREWRRLLRSVPLAELFLKTAKDGEARGATAEDVETFLARVRRDTPRPVYLFTIDVPVNIDGPYTCQKVRSITFGGDTIPVPSHTWDEMIVRVCEKVARENPSEFPRVLNQITSSRNRRYFSKDPDPLVRYQSISETSIHVEQNLAANNAFALCEAIAKLFGYEPSVDVEIY